MELLMAGPSPYARKVCVVLHETGQAADVALKTVVAAPGGTGPDLSAANPLGKIPALVREDGPTLYDSRVICRFLDARAQSSLYPAGKWETLVLEATADGIMDAAVLMIYEKRFRAEPLQSVDWLEAQWNKVAGALDAIEARWMSHLEGPVDIAHIGVGCALGYLDFRHADRDWRAGRASLSGWYARFSEREAMRATVPQG